MLDTVVVVRVERGLGAPGNGALHPGGVTITCGGRVTVRFGDTFLEPFTTRALDARSESAFAGSGRLGLGALQSECDKENND